MAGNNYTFGPQYLPGGAGYLPGVNDVETAARQAYNPTGLEEIIDHSPGGININTLNFGTPFQVVPGFTGSILNQAIIGPFRSQSSYNFHDFIHLQFFGDAYSSVVVDQNLIGLEAVTVTGPGIVMYEIVWDGAAAPIITPMFSPTFVMPANDDITRFVPLAFVDLDVNSSLLYLRQVQMGIIKEYFHACCSPAPVPGICPDDCNDCLTFLPITVTLAGFVGGCSDFNGAYSLSSIAGATDGCWHFMGGSAVTCTPPPGETAFNCPVGAPFPKYRHGSAVDAPIIGAMCCDGLWEIHAYVSTTNLNDCEGLRTARWFGTPDPLKSGCIPLDSAWILETTTNIFPCSNTSCPGCTNCCDIGDCFQCVSGGTCVTS